MSSLIFLTDETQALVATDTLAVDSHGNPAFFCSKASHIPHLRVIVAGTGAAGFANEWSLHASTWMVIKGIHNLDYHTPNGLIKLWAEYRAKNSVPEDFTTTVYQFGISEETGKVVSFAYRSTNNFVSEELGYGTGVKPECDVQEGNLFELIPGMMKQQRDIQSTAPKSERIYIGGEIFAFHLSKNGCNTLKMGEFEDFSIQETSIFEQFTSNQS